ncbi:MAG: helix-turn-helix domain-containing protein [Alphaproteobacteria bacterium]|nr:helix-turn-helix domain-containing protein [Alphaproteobacteria bacterium]
MRTKPVTVEMPVAEAAAAALPALTLCDANGAYQSIDLRLRLVEAGLRGSQNLPELLQKLPEFEAWIIGGPSAEEAPKPRAPRGGKRKSASTDTEARDAKIRELLAKDMPVKEIAEKVGCSTVTVYKVKKG